MIRRWFQGGHPVFAFWVALIAHLADFITTVVGIRLGAEEANALPSWVITNTGFIGFAFFKLSGVALFTVLGWRSRFYAAFVALPVMAAAVSNAIIIADLASV